MSKRIQQATAESTPNQPRIGPRIGPLVGTLLGVLLLAAPSGAAQERYVKDRDLKKLTEALVDYSEAMQARSKINEAREAFEVELKSVNKRLKKNKKVAIDDLLASPYDLGHVIWMTYGFAKARTRKGKVDQVEWTGGYFRDEPFEYAIWTPPKYSVKQGPYPMVITIPDVGEDPKQHLIERWQSNDLKNNVILVAPQMPEDTSQWLENPGKAAILTAILAVPETHAIDFDRVYLAGRGLGVSTAVAVGSYWPDRWAGIIGRAGDAGSTPATNFRNLPTIFAGGGKEVTDFAQGVEDAGYGNCTVQPAALGSDIWNWIQAHPRQSYPDHVTLAPTATFANRAYWVQVPRTDGETPVRVDATIDRDENTITVTGEGVDNVTLFFCDALVDMDRPITVIANGQTTTQLIPRSYPVTLDLFYYSKIDPGKIFVAADSYVLQPLSKPGEGEGEEGSGK